MDTAACAAVRWGALTASGWREIIRGLRVLRQRDGMRCLTFSRANLPTARSVGAKEPGGRLVWRLSQSSRHEVVVAWARVVAMQAVRRGQILDIC